jgi:hypothetical protein
MISSPECATMILVVDDDQAFLEQAQKALNRERQVFLGLRYKAGMGASEAHWLLSGAG